MVQDIAMIFKAPKAWVQGSLDIKFQLDILRHIGKIIFLKFGIINVRLCTCFCYIYKALSEVSEILLGPKFRPWYVTLSVVQLPSATSCPSMYSLQLTVIVQSTNILTFYYVLNITYSEWYSIDLGLNRELPGLRWSIESCLSLK